jgi:hypothetical protein
MILRASATQASQTTIFRVLAPASRAKILEMEAGGGDPARLEKRKRPKKLTPAEKLEIIRLYDNPSNFSRKTQRELAVMFQVPIYRTRRKHMP